MKIDTLTSIRVSNDDGTIYTINEGDDIICQVNSGDYYIGKLIMIAKWEKDNSQSYNVICIDTFRKYYSFNIIKTTDITCLKPFIKESKEGKRLIKAFNKYMPLK